MTRDIQHQSFAISKLHSVVQVLAARRRLNAQSVPYLIQRKLVYAYVSVAANAIQVDSAHVARLF